MANTRSAAKRARQAERRIASNRRVSTAVKTQTKGVREAIKSGKSEAVSASVRKFSSTVDKAAKTGRIHRNKANRLKSRIAKAISVAKA